MYSIIDDDGKVNMVEEPSTELRYTYADYLQWKFEERLELFRGKIFKLAAPNTKHQKVSIKLALCIGNYLENKSCFFFIAPFDVRLPVKNKKKDDQIITVVQLDLSVVCDPSKIDAKGVCGAPDLVIEILSPGNSQKEVKYKFELYEEAGVKEYWIINTEEQNIVVFILNEEKKFGGARMFANGDVIKAASVGGLKVNVTEIFKN